MQLAVKKMAIMVGLLAILFMIVPAFANAAGGTISGKIQFPANVTDMAGNKINNVTMLTIFAVNTATGFANTTNPEADGTYKIIVPMDSTYSIWVYPKEVIEWTDDDARHTRYAQYPDSENRMFLIDVSGDVSNVNINSTKAGEYRAPDPATFVRSSVTPTQVPTTAPTTVPTPTPGFTVLMVVAGLLVVIAGLGRIKA